MPIEIPGLKAGTLLAGFLGSVVSLRFLQTLTVVQAVLAVITGAVVAGYTAPIVQLYLSLSAPVEHGVGFLLGLTSMNLVPGVVRLTDKFKEDPFWFIDKLRGTIKSNGGDK